MAVHWYYKVMGQESGPVSPAELKDLAESGLLAPDVLVRKGTDGDWVPAGRVKGLFEGASAATAGEGAERPAVSAAPGREPAPADDRGGPADRALAEPPFSGPQAGEVGWYCKVMGKEIGPLSPIAFKKLADSGFLTPRVPVRKGVGGDWVPASRVKGLLDERPSR